MNNTTKAIIGILGLGAVVALSVKIFGGKKQADSGSTATSEKDLNTDKPTMLDKAKAVADSTKGLADSVVGIKKAFTKSPEEKAKAEEAKKAKAEARAKKKSTKKKTKASFDASFGGDI